MTAEYSNEIVETNEVFRTMVVRYSREGQASVDVSMSLPSPDQDLATYIKEREPIVSFDEKEVVL